MLPFNTIALSNAISRLEDALAQPYNEFLRDSVIQRFEFCIELSWKTAKKKMGITTSSPKDVIRLMAQSDYITNVDLWLRAIDERNNAAHTYNETMANQVYAFVKSFVPELKALKKQLDRI